MATTTERGYGWAHRKERASWKPYVEAGMVTCWRCQQTIQPGEPWDLGHSDDRTRYEGPEHANRCNRAAAGRRSHGRRGSRRPTERHPGLITTPGE